MSASERLRFFCCPRVGFLVTVELSLVGGGFFLAGGFFLLAGSFSASSRFYGQFHVGGTCTHYDSTLASHAVGRLFWWDPVQRQIWSELFS